MDQVTTVIVYGIEIIMCDMYRIFQLIGGQIESEARLKDEQEEQQSILQSSQYITWLTQAHFLNVAYCRVRIKCPPCIKHPLPIHAKVRVEKECIKGPPITRYLAARLTKLNLLAYIKAG